MRLPAVSAPLWIWPAAANRMTAPPIVDSACTNGK